MKQKSPTKEMVDLRARPFFKVEDHPEEEVEKDEDEEDKWWEEKQEEEEKVGKKVAKKDAATDPWEWRGSTKEEDEDEEKEEKKTRGPTQTLDEFENDNGLKGLVEEEEEDGDICNFDLDLYSGAF